MPRVTLIGARREVAATLAEALAGDYELNSVDAAEQALAVLRGSSPVDAVLVGPAVSSPLLLALRIQAARPHLGIVILAGDEHAEAMRRALAAAPLLSTDVQVLHDGDGPEAIAAAVKGAAVRARRRRNRPGDDDPGLTETAGPPASAAGTYLSLLLEHAPAGIVVVDVQGRIAAANGRALDQLGIGDRAALGEALPILFPDPGPVRDLVARSFRAQGPVTERVERHSESGVSSLELTAIAVAGAEPTALVLMRDTTETLQALEEAQTVRARLEFLADAGVVLASSLDYEATLGAVTKLAVPAIADWCAADIADEDGTLRRLAVAHTDSSKEQAIAQLIERYPPDPESPYGPYEVVRTGRPHLFAEIPDSLLEEVAQDEEHLAALREFGLRSAMVVPIGGADGPLGVLTFASAESGRIFGRDDLALAEELARRAGIAIENARLFAGLSEAERRYRDLVGDVQALVWEWDVARNEPRFISRHVEEMLGYPADCFISEPSLAWGITHPDDREALFEQRRRAVRSGEDFESQYRVFDAAGRTLWVRDVVRCVRDERHRVAILRGVTVDVSPIRRARTREEVDHKITQALADSATLEEAAPKILRVICDELDWDIGEFWRVEPQEEVLCLVDAVYPNGDEFAIFEREGRAARFAKGRGLPGAVWERGERVWVENLADGPVERSAQAIGSAGLQSAFGFPIHSGGGLVGVMAFFTRRRRPLDEPLLNTLGPAGSRIGQFIVQAAAVEALRASDSRVRAMLDTAHDAVITIDHTGRTLEFSKGAEAIFGFDRADVIGRPLADLIVPPELRDAHRAGIARIVETGQSTVLDRRLEMPAVRADGSRRMIELTISRVGTLEPPLFTAYARDITEARNEERRREVEHAVARVLSEHTSVEGALSEIVTILGSTLGWAAGAAWKPDSGNELVCVAAWAADSNTERFGRVTARTRFASGVGLPGRVFASGRPASIRDLSGDDNFPRKDDAVEAGLHGAFGFPVVSGGEVLGVLEFFTRDGHDADEQLKQMMAAVGSQIGQFMRRREAEEQLHLQKVLLESQAEATIDGILVVAPDGEILFHNARFREIWGLTRESLEGRLRSEVMPLILPKVVDPEAFQRRAGELMADPVAIGRDELHLVDGRVLDRFSTPLREPSGRLRGRAMYFRDVTAEKRVERVLRENEERFAFLADVSSLLVSSLDEQVVLDRLVRRAVPALGDWAVVDLADQAGGYRRVALAHSDPALERGAAGVHGLYEPHAGDAGGVPQVLRSGRPVLAPIATQAPLDPGSTPAQRRAVEALGLGSYVVVPLAARGRVLGTMTLVASPGGRRFGPGDLALAEEVARRAALAVDNARLFHDRAHVAKTLQQSLLPPDLPEIPGVEVAARYRAAGEGADVGGDFYDLFRTAGRNWAFVMGDVCGKGADAAAVTALARYTLRAAAMRMRKPANILRTLNEALLAQGDETKFCTVAFARLSLRGSMARATVACGGHPQPLVLRASGEVEPVGGRGSLIGVLDQPSLTEEVVDLGPGDAVVLYTDGVTEARGAAGTFGEDALAGLVASCRGLDADGIAGRIEQHIMDFQQGRPRDDVALLVLKVKGARSGVNTPEPG